MLRSIIYSLIFFALAAGRAAFPEEEDTDDMSVLQTDTNPMQSGKDSPYNNAQILARAIQLIRQDYVNGNKVSYKDLTYSALRGMLSELDPHSQFMEPDEFQDMEDDTKSEFGGVGIVVTIKNGSLTIVNPMEDTPSFKAGLLPGDQILKINGEDTTKFQLNDAIQKLRGKPGEKATLTIYRPSTRQIKDYKLTRVIIKLPSVKDAQILPAQNGVKIGYVRITQFNEPTAAELVKALDKLEKQGMQALILDLRYNPGGLLSSAVDVCGQFLPPNKLVVSTEGRTPTREYRTSSKLGEKRKYPIAILVNYASASGAEIVAGALKDLHRAILVGETTFGKGSVQSVISLPDGSALRITTAKYFTPSHVLIHEHGVTPNIRIALTYNQEVALMNYRKDKEATSSHQLDTLLPDPQLERAIDALEGILIYTQRQSQPKDNKAS